MAWTVPSDTDAERSSIDCAGRSNGGQVSMELGALLVFVDRCKENCVASVA
jgi:uncharacterized metal-binding protein